MKTLMFSDIHFKNRADHLSHAIAACQWVESLVEEHKPELVVFLGDLHDDPVSVEIPVLVTMRSSFSSLAKVVNKNDGRFVMIDGNHDKYDYTGSLSVTAAMEDIPHLRVVHEYLRIGSMAFLSFHRSINQFKQWLDRARAEEVQYLAIHQDLLVPFERSAPVRRKGVHTKAFEGFKRVFCGHYHDPLTQDNLVVVGAPFSSSFGDLYNDRGALLYDMADDALIRLVNPSSHLYVSTVWDGEMSQADFVLYVKTLAENTLHLRVECPMTWFQELEELRPEFAELRLVNKKVDVAEQVQSTVTTDPERVFLRWVKQQPKPDRKTLYKAGRRILNAIQAT